MRAKLEDVQPMVINRTKLANTSDCLTIYPHHELSQAKLVADVETTRQQQRELTEADAHMLLLVWQHCIGLICLSP